MITSLHELTTSMIIGLIIAALVGLFVLLYGIRYLRNRPKTFTAAKISSWPTGSGTSLVVTGTGLKAATDVSGDVGAAVSISAGGVTLTGTVTQGTVSTTSYTYTVTLSSASVTAATTLQSKYAVSASDTFTVTPAHGLNPMS
jgi:hypothetical protein